jgi:hypothetical protein
MERNTRPKRKHNQLEKTINPSSYRKSIKCKNGKKKVVIPNEYPNVFDSKFILSTMSYPYDSYNLYISDYFKERLERKLSNCKFSLN